MKVKNSIQFSLVFGLIIAAGFSRLIPHAPNFTAVGAMALFAGAMWGLSIWTLIVPMASLALTDLIFGAHPTMIYVYGAFALIAILGALNLQKRNGSRLVGITLFSSLLFYFITNFGVWLSAGLYPSTSAGLMECLLAGLPFLKYQVLGDITYTSILFAGYELLARRFVVAKSSQN